MIVVFSSVCVGFNELSYIEMYGIGIQVGDVVEMEFVFFVFVFDEEVCFKNCLLYVGFVKVNVGYGEGVLGVISFVKVFLMMQYNIIVFYCGIKFGSKIN